MIAVPRGGAGREAGPASAGQAAAYSAAAARWAAGPDRVYYRPLGAALVRALGAALGRPLAGARVLDAGAGTGAVSVELEAAGARVVALDRALGMLAYRRADRPPAAVADAAALPVRPGSVAAVTAGCLLAHLPDPSSALGELAAALAPGGVLAASAFPSAWRDPLKAVVESALVAAGWRPPPWYEELKGAGESATGSGGAFRELAVAAGLSAEVAEVVVPITVDDADAVVDWRLGMAQTAPWIDGLAASDRERLRARAADAVRTAAGAGPVRLDVPLLVLVARAGARHLALALGGAPQGLGPVAGVGGEAATRWAATWRQAATPCTRAARAAAARAQAHHASGSSRRSARSRATSSAATASPARRRASWAIRRAAAA